MAPEPTPAKSGKLSLYADLLDPSTDNSSTPGTISRGPVVFKQSSGTESHQDDSAAAKKQQISAASLRFQPTKRPQLAAQKAKAKPTLSKPPTAPAASVAPAPNASSAGPSGAGSTPAPANTAARPPVKSTLADWTATNDDDDVNGFYGGEKRQRGGRKKRKKNREAEMQVQNWDDIYDPSRPNNYEEYKQSDEKIREVRDWKDRLYAHRIAQRRSSDIMSDEEDSRPPLKNQFPPPAMNFAPPPNLNDIPPKPPTPEPPAEIPDDATGEDAYARRLRLSQNQGNAPPIDTVPPPPPPPSNPPPVAAQPASATISRPPVRYSLPPPPEEISMAEAELEAASTKENEGEPSEEVEAPRSNRPGQKGFAQRLLSKYGWTEGSGLGANESGMVKPLQVKVEKQKKRPDSEGGGFVGPSGRGKIIGGQKKGGEDEGRFGAMSEVVVLYGMVDGMDLDAELEDGGLMQEIGEECAEKYGRVERVYIDRNSTGSVPIFVKFTSQLSGLRAVNALEGRIFNGNAITARFFNNDKFERGIYQE